MMGSTASLLASVAPDIVRSVQGDTTHAQAGRSSPSSISRRIKASVSPPPALSPPTAIREAAMPQLVNKSPGLQHVIEGGWEGMFRSEAIADGKRPHPG